MLRTIIKWLLAPMWEAKADPVPARRIRVFTETPYDRAIACEWGGRNYWKG